MEQKVRLRHSHAGIALVTVLFITGIGLLLGAGALILFRFQCHLRIDRQHEMEKVYAVRSALNYIRTYEGALDETLSYYTKSDRELNVIVTPAKQIFPDFDKDAEFIDPPKHFAVERLEGVDNPFPEGDQYIEAYGCEYGSDPTTNLSIRIYTPTKNVGPCLDFNDLTCTNVVKRWVNFSMRDTGGWLTEEYGRRYLFYLHNYAGRGYTTDVVRLAIVRDIANSEDDTGKALDTGWRHGWPLSRDRERAIVLDIRSKSASEIDKSEMKLYEYWRENGALWTTNILTETTFPARFNMGMQIASNTVSLFYIDNLGTKIVKTSPGYTFSTHTAFLTKETCEYFSNEVIIGGKKYPGIEKKDGRPIAPELRAVIEVESPKGNRDKQSTLVNNFRVARAYQYDVDLMYQSQYGVISNRATVVQKTGTYVRGGLNYTTLTYDTHGTENRGFRKDEREAEKRRSGQ